jgi:hypothetical protein
MGNILAHQSPVFASLDQSWNALERRKPAVDQSRRRVLSSVRDPARPDLHVLRLSAMPIPADQTLSAVTRNPG